MCVCVRVCWGWGGGRGVTSGLHCQNKLQETCSMVPLSKHVARDMFNGSTVKTCCKRHVQWFHCQNMLQETCSMVPLSKHVARDMFNGSTVKTCCKRHVQWFLCTLLLAFWIETLALNCQYTRNIIIFKSCKGKIDMFWRGTKQL